ncbi:hypothetical protein Q4555_00945 [Octadecabacter sp. 1_MG-2023]|uniref:hypothetical protein n=1 Tax=unclassified Octadecabacter TaxID=196158 RepID=UPI001C0876E9|nr:MULTISPECIES: hypothetical protein [unclassified Octadecabacter]MBU2993330.1 hypothetical protein [Octadecabacter sp. B2R22]MDO6733214.1 hypothetical protein [Octadecabacter sp. 1_MG-2023]
MRVLSILVCAIALPAAAQDLPTPMICAGPDDEWSLKIDQDTAEFSYLFTSNMDIPLQTRPRDAQWPVALTLIGRGDSAIAIITPEQCDGSFGITVLTQRGETPLMLVGCCQDQSN